MENRKIEELSYPELQKEAKKLGLPAKGKKDYLLQKVLEATKQRSKRKAEDRPEDEPRTAKFAKPSHEGGEETLSSTKQESTSNLAEIKKFSSDTEKGVIAYLEANSIVDLGTVNKTIDKLLESLKKSNDLAYQQTVFGTCLKAPLPLQDTLLFENFFSEDIVDTKIYKEFTGFVDDITVAAQPQKLKLGVVVQVSGYGKTHLARVYTCRNKAVYLKFAELANNNFYIAIDTKIDELRNKYLPTDASQRTGKNILDFTRSAKQALEIFLLASIEHYVFFYHKIGKKYETLTDAQITQMCTLVFENGCADLFLQRVKHYWSQVGNKWWGSWKVKVLEMVQVFNIHTIFCDEVHALQSKYVGQFTHNSTPEVWSEELHKDRATYEQYVASHPEEKNSLKFKKPLCDAFKRSTSLTYMIVASLESISSFYHVGCILLTTKRAAVDYTSESETSSRDRAKIVDFPFKRDLRDDFLRFNKFIITYFGIDLDEYLKTLPEYSKIKETLGSRAVYFHNILMAIQAIAQREKPSSLQPYIKDIWSRAHKNILVQAGDYIGLLASKSPSIYWDVVFAVLYHNGYLQNNFVLPIKDLDIGYAPVVTTTEIKGATKHRIADYCMFQYIVKQSLEDTSMYTKALEHVYCAANAPGPLGEDLLKLFIIINKGQTFASLAAKKSTFHADSIAHKYPVQVQFAGEASEFEVEDMKLLENPQQYLKNRLVKVSDIVCPDGLAISELASREFVISAWQSKNWKDHLDAAKIESALESLDPKNFFKLKSKDRKAWDKKREDSIWCNKYIRVIWAIDFTAIAIAKVNEYNNDENNANTPIVLMTHARLPKELLKKFAKLLPPKKKQEAERKTEKEFNFALK